MLVKAVRKLVRTESSSPNMAVSKVTRLMITSPGPRGGGGGAGGGMGGAGGLAGGIGGGGDGLGGGGGGEGGGGMCGHAMPTYG